MMMAKKFFASLIAAVMLGSPLAASTTSLDSLVDASLAFALPQLKNATTEIGSYSRHPEKTQSDGAWTQNSRGNWTSGFFSGNLWYAYALTKDPTWRDYAIGWSSDLEPQKNNTGTHDVGFQMMSSWGNWYKLTGREQNVGVLITTANSLAQRYNATIGCLRSWGDKNSTQNFQVIVDNMMNLELLFWAAKNGGDQRLYDIAVSHAEKTMANHVREDGSTFHVLDYNFDGTVKSKYTHQGYQDWSTWSRGQAWGIYGFTVAYRETHDERFLQTARKLADYFLARLPDDLVPYSDFDSPNIPNESKDVSASAITCSALFELDQFAPDGDYRTAAEQILTSVLKNYLSKGTNLSSILQKGCVRYGSHEQGLIYADYYILETIIRYLGIELEPIDPVEPEPELFSNIPYFGDMANYTRYTESRWSVGPDLGDDRYYINTTDYANADGERLGEYTLVKDSVYTDFTLTFKARSPEDFAANAWVDFAVVFGFVNNENYNYAMLNSNPAENGNTIFAVRNGARQPIDFIPLAGLTDNEYHDYEFAKSGTTIAVKIDGEAFYTFTNAEYGRDGQVGLGSYNDAVFFDDIAVTRSTSTTVASNGAVAAEFVLLPNYPNPFNLSTTIRFTLPAAQHVKVVVYDAMGRLVRTLYDGQHASGSAQLVWHGDNAAGEIVGSGIYVVTLESTSQRKARKMILVK